MKPQFSLTAWSIHFKEYCFDNFTESAVEMILTVCNDDICNDLHLILSPTGLTPSPTSPPRGAEADMPGVLQNHVES